MRPLHVCRGEWRQHRVFELEMILRTLTGQPSPTAIENWNILAFTGKELELVKEAQRYHLDIARVCSTKKRDSGTVDLAD